MTARLLMAYTASTYLFGAAMTFNFAVPIDCHSAGTKDELWACVGDNLVESAIDGVIWPVFWANKAVPQ